jgi:hypothetical protein
MANISYRMGGESIEYQPSEQKFLNSSEADSYIFPDYKNNWEYPRI